MKLGVKTAIIIGLLLIVGISIFANSSSKESTTQEVDKYGFLVKIGDVAPTFSTQIANSNQTFNLSDYKGKVIMIQFTANWCGVCRKEMPFIEKEIYQEHKNNKDFVLLALDYKETLEKINILIKATGVTYPIGFDKNGEIFHKYAGEDAGVTRNVIIGKNGKIAFLTRLFERKEFNEMKAVIKDELNKNL